MTHPVENTLNAPRVSGLLERLFAAAATSDAPLAREIGALAPEERARRVAELTADYRRFYGDVAKQAYLAVSRETARLRTTRSPSIQAVRYE